MKNGGRFKLEGEEYKRPIKNPHPPKMQKWYQKKSFYLLCSREHDDILFSRALAGELSSAFSETARLYRYLRDISDMKDGGGA